MDIIKNLQKEKQIKKIEEQKVIKKYETELRCIKSKINRFKLQEKVNKKNILSVKNKINGKDTEILKYISIIAESRFGSSIEYAYKELKRLSKKRKLLELSKEIQKDIEEETFRET